MFGLNLSRSRQVLAVLQASFVALVLSTSVAVASPLPNRQVFDWKSDQIGAKEGPVFNSYINTPKYGDERNFFDGARSDQPGDHNQGFNDTVNSVSAGNQTVVLRVYIHNDANQSLNGNGTDGKGVAKDVSVRIALPGSSSKQQQATAYISSSNATPKQVSDTVLLVDDAAFSLQYVPGSAIIYNGAHPAGLALPDTIVSSGAPVGYQNMDGVVAGGFDHQAIVEIHVKVVPASVATNSTPPASTTPGKPLTNTGPGSTLAVFFVTAGAGTIGYRLYAVRRLSRNS